jgi:hypothetical protein
MLREFLSSLFLLEADDVLQRLTGQAVSLFHADVAWLRLFDEEGRLRSRAVAGDEEVVRLMPLEREGQLMGRGRWMLDNRKPLAVRDMAKDPTGPYRGPVQATGLHGFLGALLP